MTRILDIPGFLGTNLAKTYQTIQEFARSCQEVQEIPRSHQEIQEVAGFCRKIQDLGEKIQVFLHWVESLLAALNENAQKLYIFRSI